MRVHGGGGGENSLRAYSQQRPMRTDLVEDTGTPQSQGAGPSFSADVIQVQRGSGGQWETSTR